MNTPINMAAVSSMGAQFNTNVFEKLAKTSLNTAKHIAKNMGKPGVQSGSGKTNFRTTKAAPRTPAGALPAGSTNKSPSAVSSGVTKAPALPPGSMIATPYHQGATPHSVVPSTPALPAGKYRGIATPYQGGNRVIPMSGNAALTNRVNPNFSFSDTESHSPMNRTQFNQPSTTPFKAPTTMLTHNATKQAYSSMPTPPEAPPAAERSGGKTAPTSNLSGQFSDVSTKDNSPFPTHEHPAGASNMILPRLTAAQSEPGKPNEFVVSSRNAKPGGIAAAGSRLEAWAQTKGQAMQARQASKRAGGRDKALSSEASRLESMSRAPLSRFAP